MSIEQKLKNFCQKLGFDLFGIVRPEKSERADFFKSWLAEGNQADMQWLGKNLEKRIDSRLILEDCQTVIVLGCSYFNRNYSADEIGDKNRALIARYAWGNDYHEVLPKKLQQIVQWLEKNVDNNLKHKYFTDTGPVLEKELAVKAGLGFIGKNTQLINPKIGSYLFLAEIFTQADLLTGIYNDEKAETLHATSLRTRLDKSDAGNIVGAIHELPLRENISCGSCRKCLDACPTRALVAPYKLDARKCLSYQTIENRGEIPDDLKKKIGNRIFGCDICQEVCPWNRFAKETKMEELKTKNNRDVLNVDTIKNMTREEYQKLFKNSAVKRAKFEGLKRNAGGNKFKVES